MRQFFRQFGQFHIKSYFLASVHRNDYYFNRTIIARFTVVKKDVSRSV